ncbi:hypothetical protein FACS1894158_08960 [Betaproteobacteria bacterium]|nr:hypothetical protein FACS1894158_08960 [Betaproteobacteria bacterium]
MEFIEGYEVPSRTTRYSNKTNPNESTKGSDVIAFKFTNSPNPNLRDELAIFEAKTKFKGKTAETKNRVTRERLQIAIDDSTKDRLRIATSLNAMKQKFLNQNDKNAVARVERFQNEADNPYKTINGAVALVCNSNYSDAIATTADARNHPNNPNLRLIIIKGRDMMALGHALYRRAADEA